MKQRVNLVEVINLILSFQKISDPKTVFKKWGLANSSYITRAKTKFMTYKDILASNGHDENTDVHYLKLDVEATEFDVSLSS